MLTQNKSIEFTKNDLKELAESYKLDLPVVVRQLEEIITNYLVLRYKIDIDFRFNDHLDGYEVKAYMDRGNDLQIVDWDLTRLKKSHINELLDVVHFSLGKAEAINSLVLYKRYIGSVIRGDVQRVMPDGSVYVEVYDELTGLPMICVCEPVHKTKHEIFEGSMSFYVSSVKLIDYESTMRLMLRVSRCSKTLPEKLLKTAVLFYEDHPANIKCIKRIAGAYSKITVDRKIPQMAIKEVSDELKERIRVFPPTGVESKNNNNEIRTKEKEWWEA